MFCLAEGNGKFLEPKTIKIKKMVTIQEVNPAQAYFEGMLWAAFAVRVFSDKKCQGTGQWHLLKLTR